MPLTFSTDADYWVEGKTRGEVCLEFLKTWKDAGIPERRHPARDDDERYKVSGTEQTRGPIKAGFFADLIAVPGNPLDDVNALKQVQFVMKDGIVFKSRRRDDTRRVFQRRARERLANQVAVASPRRPRSTA